MTYHHDQPPDADDTRRLQELPPAEALRLLAGVPFGRIVFTRQALPAIRPVNHVVVDGHIVIRSDPGTILGVQVARAETVVAYEADELDGHERLGWSVIVTGVARAVTDPGEAARLKALLRPWVAGGMEQVIRIRPEITTGFRLLPAAGAPERTEADLRG
ncbi:nitroimidazol reductase NimA-like FMN-containing flavoprotein (pyridoxamine 5'-phosphate oxidase superfamily) [Nonomuraea fuscirosea]|uniref:Nitroimidazol reductase NimA-like FMN-containing flavoprotein (Pyridoxamine 5'-phosphate oxidase superfamily) n=1 Tax=Nonomuraea fuscirosea TaxID=1291556 RepID=A0A2T0ME68_9ACTN|nr:pyridoxamine 5'-phosphate oxidase family protein [Nonomuraea fuscirosea]PRX55840.1 nitroimidazol reductase NimA-like FMN-containing flavoprotein (pyridoxamine 5'-phosphate oxidase superfamily) [Nonomuraea fuscirosea]